MLDSGRRNSCRGTQVARCWPCSPCRALSERRASRRGVHKSRDAPRRHAQRAARWADSLTATICVLGLGEAVVAAVPQQNRAADCAQIDVPFPIQETLSQPAPLVPCRSPSATVSANAEAYRWSSSSLRSREDSSSSRADTTPGPPETRDRSASGSIQRRTPMPQRPDRPATVRARRGLNHASLSPAPIRLVLPHS